MKTYFYNGPVMEFDRVIINQWKGTTEAETDSKARNNLAFRFKQQYKKMPNTKITLPGKMVVS